MVHTYKYKDEQFYLGPEALELVKAAWNPPVRTEMIPLDQANKRMLAQDCYARYTNPPGQLCAFDGIAVHFADFEQGIPDTRNWKRGVEFDIADTGDSLPAGFDTVIGMEALEFLGKPGVKQGGTINGYSYDDPFVVTKAPFKRGMGVRQPGSAFHKGDLVLPKDTVLTPEKIAYLMTCGYTEVLVYQKLRAAIIPSGNELIYPGQTPKEGEVLESNSTFLSLYLEERGVATTRYPIVKDSVEDLTRAVEEACNAYDLVLLNAGTSRGSEDFAAHIINTLGTQLYHWTNIGPGRPSMAGVIHGTLIVVLPGPPLACSTVLNWLVEPLLRAHSPANNKLSVHIQATLADTFKSSTHELIFQRRVTVTQDEAGAFIATPLDHSGTHALAKADGYILIYPEKPVQKGDVVDVYLYRPEDFLSDIQAAEYTVDKYNYKL